MVEIAHNSNHSLNDWPTLPDTPKQTAITTKYTFKDILEVLSNFRNSSANNSNENNEESLAHVLLEAKDQSLENIRALDERAQQALIIGAIELHRIDLAVELKDKISVRSNLQIIQQHKTLLAEGRFALAEKISERFPFIEEQEFQASDLETDFRKTGEAERAKLRFEEYQQSKDLRDSHSLPRIEIPYETCWLVTRQSRILMIECEGELYLRHSDNGHFAAMDDFVDEVHSSLGNADIAIYPRGGAILRFDESGQPSELYGQSGKYGTCDKHLMAEMIREQYPDCKLLIS